MPLDETTLSIKGPRINKLYLTKMIIIIMILDKTTLSIMSIWIMTINLITLN